jgi:DNA mismatch repair protein MutL
MAERPPIQALPKLLVNQIAAGEVVERPASVVKELVDNALDAGARRITVELEQGGIELVRVSDDGQGIPEQELALALAPHATSKIRGVADLERIATMGFRGEALASITSVARVSLRSRTAQQPGAAQIEAEGDTLRPPAPAAGPVGTSVSVRNLFFNTPARRKFLRTISTEQGRCAEVVRSLAMAHPGVGFTLLSDGRTALDLPPDQDARARIEAVLGPELAGELIEVSLDDPGPPTAHGAEAGSDRAGLDRPMSIWGLVGRPSIARATGQAQHLYLNGRPIKDKTALHALKEAYRGLLEPSRFPTAVLMIEMDPGAVDVNVHPAKIEVRFREPSRVHSLVFHAVRDALQRADLTPSITAGPGGNGAWGPQAILDPRSSPGGPRGGGVSAGAVADFLARQAPSHTGGRVDYDDLRRAVAGGGAGPRGGPVGGQGASVYAGGATSSAAFGPFASMNGSGGAALADPSRGEPNGAFAHGAGQATMPAPIVAPRLLQVHNSFLVTQDEQGVLIIDQHALHERVMFEKLLERLGGGDLESQPLLAPLAINATPAQMESAEGLGAMFKRLGIEVEPLGPSSLGVRAFPTFLFERGVDAGEFLVELLDRAGSEQWGAWTGNGRGGATGEEAALHEVLDMMACKAAVKAGDKLSESELGELLALRERIERSSNCPHGRPTSIRLTIKELEKRFGRS